MSGNSSRSRSRTAPIVRRLSARVVGDCGHGRDRYVSRYLPICTSSPSSSFARLDPAAVHVGAVQAALVLDRVAVVTAREDRVRARDGHVVEKDGASGERPISISSPSSGNVSPALPPPERTTSAVPSIADRRAGSVLVRDLLRREGHRRVPAGSSLDEQRAALRAVVGALGVLEAALRAVDVRHGRLLAPVRRCGPRREDLGELVDVDLVERALLPPPTCCWSRACSSAFRMSILPCRIRRRYDTSFSSSTSSLDQVAKLLVGEGCQIGQRFHGFSKQLTSSKPGTGFNLELRV